MGRGNCPAVKLETLPMTLLLSISALGTGCFAPDASDRMDEPDLAGSTGAEAPDAAEAESDGPGAEETAGVDGGAEGESTESGEADDGGIDDGETGAEPEATGDTGDETGVICEEELGTEAHCLDCDDACDDGETCTAGGCAAPSDVGFADAFAGVGGYPGRLYGYALQVENDAVVSSLNFHAVGNGGDVQLALFSDDSGSPSELLASSDVYGDYGAGPHELPVEPVELTAGTYWVMARNDFPSQIGLNFDPNIAPPFPLTSIFIEFGEALPETLVAPETFNSYEINLWVTVLELS